MGTMTKIGVWGVWIALCAAGPVRAQFHQKKSDGGTAVNAKAVTNAANGTANSGTGGRPQVQTQGQRPSLPGKVDANPFGAMYIDEHWRDSRHQVRFGEQDEGPITKWGRAIHHSDGTYTESVSEPGQRMMTQLTKSKSTGTTLQKRVINFDESGRAQEVLIYDGRGRFKYRGVLHYDKLGRFQEERLFDGEEKLLRRKIQEYGPDGRRRPIHTVDYVKNVPDDLKLVISRESEEEKEQRTSSRQQREGGQQWDRKGSSGGNSRGRQGQAATATAKRDESTSRGLGRLFGGRKRE